MKERINCECGANFNANHRWSHNKNSQQHADFLLKERMANMSITKEDAKTLSKGLAHMMITQLPVPPKPALLPENINLLMVPSGRRKSVNKPAPLALAQYEIDNFLRTKKTAEVAVQAKVKARRIMLEAVQDCAENCLNFSAPQAPNGYRRCSALDRVIDPSRDCRMCIEKEERWVARE